MEYKYYYYVYGKSILVFYIYCIYGIGITHGSNSSGRCVNGTSSCKKHVVDKREFHPFRSERYIVTVT